MGILDNPTTEQTTETQELHLIGNAHMDPVWVWDWREGFGEVWATFKSALERIDEQTDVRFSASSAAYYSWIEQHDPEMFRAICSAVAAGRWCVVGGMWIEPDCNIPSGESLCRQLLHGQRFFQRAFGFSARTGYNIDSFGHQGGLPAVLSAAGLDSYVMMRPMDHERTLPANAFTWTSPGDHHVTGYRIPVNYETDAVDALVSKIEETAALAREQGTEQMCFFGIGNHGGGPTKSMIAEIDRQRVSNSSLVYSDPDRFFARLRGSSVELPIVEGELQHHAIGCYSASGWVKAANRHGEGALLDAETFEALASRLVGREYHAEELANAWCELLLCQFHDILAGSSSAQAYETVRARYGFVETVADRTTTNALYEIAHRVDTRIEAIGARERESPWTKDEGAASAFVVFNPLSWPVRQLVEARRSGARVLNSTGQLVTSQAVNSAELTIYPSHALFEVELGALGYEVFWLQGSRLHYPEVVSATSPEIRNGRFHVIADPSTGAVTSLFDEERGIELVGNAGIRPIVLSDESDTWSHGLTRYDGELREVLFESWEVVEHGALRSTLRLRFRCGESRLIEDVSLINETPYVQIRLRAEWTTPQCVVKLVMPWRIATDAVVTSGATYAYQEREADGDEQPLQGWLDYFDAVENRGVAITTDHLYGYDASAGTVRLTWLRNPIAADHGGKWATRVGEDFPLADSGRHEATLRIHPHEGDWREANLPALTDEHHRPAIAIPETYHDGSLAGRGSFLDHEATGRGLVRALKPSEDGQGLVLRLVEPVGRATSITLSGAALSQSIDVSLAPYEIKTIVVPDDGGPWQEVNVAELALGDVVGSD